MKRNAHLHLALAALFASVVASHATVFFNDTFANGSTLTNTTPANPTPTNTAYQLASSKAWVGASLTTNDLKFGIGATTSGSTEVEALFSTNAVSLTANGDYIQMTVVFTNTSGLLTQSSSLGFGLYNSAQSKPVAGGLNGTATTAGTPSITNGAANWQGYAALVQYNAGSHRLLTRPNQLTLGTPITDGRNQDLISNGSGSSSYSGSAGIGSAVLSTTVLTSGAGAVYTNVLVITLLTNDASSLTISNTLYSTTGTVTNFGGIATNATLLTSGFDALAIGWRATANTAATTIEISSIKIEGVATPVATPPTISSQPVAVTVATNGSCFFNVTATGVNVTYQWKRNGTNLANNANISGATGSTLFINNANVGDALSGANGYFCLVSGAGNLSVNTVTNSLTLTRVKNLTWSGAGNLWDVNTSPNWTDGVNATNFNYGDAVTFDDTGAAQASVSLTGSFLSASKWTITGNTAYAFNSSGVFAGTGSLLINSAANMQFNGLNNTFSGGTTISNTSPTAIDTFSTFPGLGSGPLTLATPGQTAPGLLEIGTTGSATVGIPNDLIVKDDATIQFDGTGTFAGVVLGNITGTAGKILTLKPQSTAILSRYRLYGTNTSTSVKLVINGNPSDQAQYNGTVFAYYGGSGSQSYNAEISGEAGFISRGNGTCYLNASNSYAGGSTFTAGTVGLGHDNALGSGPINLTLENGAAAGNTGTGTIFASGGARTITNLVQYPSGTNNATLVIGGTNNLTLTSDINLAGVDMQGTPVARTFSANNTAATTFSGNISDGAAGIGLIKIGTNTLYLNGTETYTGLTTVSVGTLAGSGTIGSSVLVTNNARIGGGASTGIGTLVIGGNLTFTNGGGFFRLNRAGSSSDQVSVTGTLTNASGTGTITVTNLGAALQVGDTFTLFNKAMSNGAAMTVTGGGAVWTNKLAVNGTIQVIPGVNTGRTNLIVKVNGSNLEMTWPADHIGWRLQAQTNGLGLGLRTNWVDVPNTATVNAVTNPINAANGAVFYRMVYP